MPRHRSSVCAHSIDATSCSALHPHSTPETQVQAHASGGYYICDVVHRGCSLVDVRPGRLLPILAAAPAIRGTYYGIRVHSKNNARVQLCRGRARVRMITMVVRKATAALQYRGG